MKSFGPDWQPDEPLILEEVGVIYSFDAIDRFTAYRYSAHYKPRDVTIGRLVYTATRDDFLALLAHWNRDEKWSYTS